MKIGIFNPYLDDLGGGEKYMMVLAECLAKNHAVTVFWDQQEDVRELQKRFLLDLSSISLSKNIFSPKVSVIERLLETRKFDALFVLSDGSIPLVLSKKLFIHFQQPMQHISSLSLLTKLKLSRVTSTFCNSKFTKSYIDKTFKVNSKILYPPVDSYPKKVKKENIILHVGRFRVRDITIGGAAIGDYKKQGLMIDVFKEMIESGLSDWRFVLGVSVQGDDEEAFATLQKSAEGFPIEFIVNQNNKRLWDLYNRARIYWHATGYGENLEIHPEYAEHFGISTVEAMEAGVVPVVINAGGQKEIVTEGENGMLWETLDEFKNKTLLLMRNQSLWQKLSNRALSSAKKYGSERFCRQLHEIIEK